MKNFFPAAAITLLSFLLAVPNATLGHEGGHDLSTADAIERAARVVTTIVDKEQLIQGETLDASWKQVTASGKCQENSEHYLISFDNRDAAKTVYVLLSITGAYKRTNFDGNFSDLRFSAFPLQDCQ